MNLTWSTSAMGSCLHAVSCVHENVPLVDPDIASTMASHWRPLEAKLHANALTVTDFWDWLLPIGCRHDSCDDLLTLIAESRPAFATNVPGTEVSTFIRDIHREWKQSFPQLESELGHRVRPLREQFQAWGPGVVARALRGLGLPPIRKATVHVLHPITGGGGGIHAGDASLRVEGLLANPSPAVPEFLRISWLLVWLTLAERERDLAPRLESQPAAAQRAATATLQSAAELELLHADSDLLSQAIELWRCGPTDPEGQEGAKQLLAWWRDRPAR